MAIKKYYQDPDDPYYLRAEYCSDNYGVPKGIHIMNKDEAKLCRRLMSETGLTEKELREHKKYRKMLSDVQKAGQINLYNRVTRFKKKVMKGVTKELKLAKEHPECLAEYEKRMRDILDDTWFKPYWLYNISPKWDLK